MMVILLGMVAFAVDLGYIMVVRTQLQTAADASALAAAGTLPGTDAEIVAAAQRFAGYQKVGGVPVTVAVTTWCSAPGTPTP